MGRRMGRVNELLREELSLLLLHELKDARVVTMTTVTEVDTSADLEHARVYVSVMATEEEQRDSLQGLRSAEGFLRRSLGARLRIRRIPALTFELDTSMERGAEMLAFMDTVAEGAGARRDGDPLP